MGESGHGVAANAGQLRKAFWVEFKSFMARHSAIPCGSARTDDWMFHDGGLNCGGQFSILRVRLAQLGVQYALDDETASSVYALLRAEIDAIEQEFGQPLTWHDPAEVRTSLIEVRRSFDVRERTEWADAFRWLCGNLERMQGVLWPVVGRRPSMGQRRQWDERSFLDDVRRWNPAVVEVARSVLSCAKEYGLAAYWGRGAGSATVTLGVSHGMVKYPLLTISSAGTVAFRFVDLGKWEPFDDRIRRLGLLRRVNMIPLLNLPEGVVDKRPAVPLRMLGGRGAMSTVSELMASFHGELAQPRW